MDPSLGETCDDGNSNACGTCPAATCKAPPITASQATTTITTSGGGQINDTGDHVTLDDGFGKLIAFEFTTGSTSIPGAIPITFVKSPTVDGAARIASNLAAAIHAQSSLGFGIDATVLAGGTTVTLANKRKSSLGNTAIAVSGLPGFVFGNITGGVPQMAGGAAGDCLKGIGCTSGGDCASGVCSTGRCN